MSIFRKNRKAGLADVIRCDESSYLIWKWRPDNSAMLITGRENAIRMGSSLRVKDGEVALFVYFNGEGQVQEYIEGPCDRILETLNIPILTDILSRSYGSMSPFQAEIYFINTASDVQIKFGVPFFDVFDPTFPDKPVSVAVRGTISFKIDDYREFVNVHGIRNFDAKAFQARIRDVLCNYIKSAISDAPAEYGIPVRQIERKLPQISDVVLSRVKARFKDDFAVSVTGVDISAIEIDDASRT